jgi:glycosyltransferase 2 family protein
VFSCVESHSRMSSIAARITDPGPALPLSWTRTAVTDPQVQRVPLPLSGLTWLAHADLPVAATFAELYQAGLCTGPGGVLLRGCAPELAAWLTTHGWAVAQVGMEGRVDLAGSALQRRSVQKMVHAARHYGVVRDVPYHVAAAEALDRLAREARPATRPQLRHLFRQRFAPGMRCFAFVDPYNQWQGAILLTLPHADLAVTELMIRRPHAPGGVIESLFAHAGAQLHAEGVRWLSLNEVPFHYVNSDLSPLERMIRLAGQQLYSVYNAPGLLRFKAKFHPIWRPVYMCAHPQISFSVLADLFTTSGCAELWLSGWRRA